MKYDLVINISKISYFKYSKEHRIYPVALPSPGQTWINVYLPQTGHQEQNKVWFYLSSMSLVGLCNKRGQKYLENTQTNNSNNKTHITLNSAKLTNWSEFLWL